MIILTIRKFEVYETGYKYGIGCMTLAGPITVAEKLNMSTEFCCPTAQSNRMQVLHVDALANSEIELFASTKKAHSVWIFSRHCPINQQQMVGGAIAILKNDGVRQWVSDDIPYISIYYMENNPVMFQSTNQTGFVSNFPTGIHVFSGWMAVNDLMRTGELPYFRKPPNV